jgi:hypothetical protein
LAGGTIPTPPFSLSCNLQLSETGHDFETVKRYVKKDEDTAGVEGKKAPHTPLACKEIFYEYSLFKAS